MNYNQQYYANHQEYFKEYYHNYHLKNREKQIEKATNWLNASESNRIKHRTAMLKYSHANKTKIDRARKLKANRKMLMVELIDRFTFSR